MVSRVTSTYPLQELVNKSVVIGLQSWEVERIIDYEYSEVFFTKDEGEVVHLTKIPEKKRKAEQLETETSPTPKISFVGQFQVVEV